MTKKNETCEQCGGDLYGLYVCMTCADEKLPWPEATDADAAKAAESKDAAAKCYESRRRSIDRSGISDGFLSQWASDVSGSKRDLQATIDANGGVAAFWGLFDVETDERVAAKIIDGKYGQCWALVDEDGRFTGRFISAFPKRRSTIERKGFYEDRELAPAIAKLGGGSGTGLAGCIGVRAITVRTDDGYPDDAVAERRAS